MESFNRSWTDGTDNPLTVSVPLSVLYRAFYLSYCIIAISGCSLLKMGVKLVIVVVLQKFALASVNGYIDG